MFDKEINDTQREIKRWLDRLDEVAVDYGARWGIGNLENFVSGETADKMRRQDKKLAVAISNQDIRAVQDLVQGSIRGWAFMEKEAIAAGHKPQSPDVMEIKLDSGFHLRICTTSTNARICTQEGVYVWTLGEVARVIESDYTLLNLVKKHNSKP